MVDRAAGPLPDAAHKVGESCVELGAHYLEEHVGLRDYLGERHLRKNGLSFYPGGGDGPLAARTEILPPELPTVPSYQLDRGRLENDLRALLVDAGVELIAGVGVEDVTLSEGGGPHEVILADGRRLTARWVVDATGRRRLLARRLGLDAPVGYDAHAAWFRLEGRLTIDDLVPASEERWHAFDIDGIRWRSTTHLMGEGYWAWIIPLPTGHTSVGVVVHDEAHRFDAIRTWPRLREWLRAHEPVLDAKVEEALDGREPLDFRCLKRFAHHTSRSFSPDRWALVGEAGVFVDPLYSPGTDFIGLANVHAGELILRDLDGEDIEERLELVDGFFRRLAENAFTTYRTASPVYGHARAMAAKVYFDTFIYWAFLCEYFFQRVWAAPVEEQRAFVPVAQRFADLNERAQRLFTAWARHPARAEASRIVLPAVPSALARLHLDLQLRRTVEESRAVMSERADLAEELLTELLVRAVTETGHPGLVREVGADRWPLTGVAQRLDAERGERRKRRRRLSRIAREVERCLGPVDGDVLATAGAAFAAPQPAPSTPGAAHAAAR